MFRLLGRLLTRRRVGVVGESLARRRRRSSEELHRHALSRARLHLALSVDTDDDAEVRAHLREARSWLALAHARRN